MQVAGGRLQVEISHYNGKTAGTKKKGKAIDLPLLLHEKLTLGLIRPKETFLGLRLAFHETVTASLSLYLSF